MMSGVEEECGVEEEESTGDPNATDLT